MKWLILMSLLMNSVVYAEEEKISKQDFKCYVDTSINEQVVFYRWQVDKAASLMASLPASRAAENERGQSAYIKDVYECVALEEDFSSIKAKKLDRATLR
ncbi:TapY2 family type IVa secretion system protein [Shewanella sp. 10N.286.54.B9]|uniref:TapY2 family type IVa secretion system protein n=1 Tax=Shewanella sp. 10N.286.54.B9 TaxID=3229719 RepID=UPI0035516959